MLYFLPLNDPLQVNRQNQYVVPFPLRYGYGGMLIDHFDMAQASELAINGYPHLGTSDEVHDYDVVPFSVLLRGVEIQADDIPGILAGSLASVEYTVSADSVNGFLATVSEVNILLTAEELSM